MLDTKKGDKILVELHSVRFYGVVVEAPTGVLYTNQCGGHACAHPEVEGFLVPLSHFDDEAAYMILRNRWCGSEFGSPVPTAEKLAALVELINEVPHGGLELRFDKSRLHDQDHRWGEAWVPVTCMYGKGFLTWENSD